MEIMYIARVYADLVREGEKTLEQIPECIKSDVEALMDEETQ